MSNNIRKRREIEQKRKQVKDALARRGINTDGKDDDAEPETLENESAQSATDDDDVTVDTLLNEGYDRDTLMKDEFAVQDRLDALNRKLNWYDRKGITPPGNVRAERDALEKLQDGRPEDGYGCMMDMRLALGEGRR